MTIFIIFIFFIIIVSIYIKSTSTSSYILQTLKSIFSNVVVLYSDSNITLCRGDKAGENFLFAITINNYSAISLQSIEILYNRAEKLHIHNKVIITDYVVDSSSNISKKLKEYEIDIWDRKKLLSISSTDDSTFNSPYDSSVLKTSDTSDDTCYIDKNTDDPIQDGAFHTHGIFSIFNNKTEHL